LKRDFQILAPAAPALDPKYRVLVFRLHQKTKLYVQFLRSPREGKNFFRL